MWRLPILRALLFISGFEVYYRSSLMKIKEMFTLRYYGVNDTTSRGAYRWSLVAILVMLVVLGLLWGRLPLEVPLYFSKPWGEERLASWYMLFILPLIGTGVTILNLRLGKRFRFHGGMVVSSFAIATITINLMLVLGLIGIIRSIV